METLRNKLQKEFATRPHLDFSSTKPPTKHAVYAMIKNLRAAAQNKQ